MDQTDLVVIGAGVAGLAAATHAARRGLEVLVIERVGAGGQVMAVERIANYPDYPGGIAGFELGPALQAVAEEAGVRFRLDSVTRIQAAGAGARLEVQGESGSIMARAVLVAAGSSRRALGVPGEDALEGRGVSHCAACDGPLFRGEPVCVVGGGDSAVGEAVVLARYASEVTLVFEGEAPHAQAYLMDALSECGNVRLLRRARVTAIEGGNGVTGVRIRSGAAEQSVPVSGVFIYAGLRAASGFLDGLVELDGAGRVVCGPTGRSSIAGVYAAGDIRAGIPYTLVAAQQSGTSTAMAIVHDLISIGDLA
ncbi:FAD-binding protein [Pigmentiphaga sp. H8]|uniref:NAD(P)/FAD-dependent oxidoreductase n=1 Tax=unclassified Pigmentiphaga TaxID=2626614 RepID=UPI000F5914B6|nr:FAD-dependent oxidoreductase [Pigmentiphaga sp. H8]AZG09758.1 FAD-binding protein [Pigmentiphaga sp. H8]